MSVAVGQTHNDGSVSGVLGAGVPQGPISFVVWALAGLSVLFDDVEESLPIFIELSYADPG